MRLACAGYAGEDVVCVVCSDFRYSQQCDTRAARVRIQIQVTAPFYAGIAYSFGALAWKHRLLPTLFGFEEHAFVHACGNGLDEFRAGIGNLPFPGLQHFVHKLPAANSVIRCWYHAQIVWRLIPSSR